MSWFNRKKQQKRAETPVNGKSRVPKGRRIVVAYYDAVENKNDNGGDIRRPAYIEMGGEESQLGGGLTMDTRLRCISTVRNLMRNSSLLKTDVSMLQLSVIGCNSDLMFYDKDDAWYRKAEALWRKWGKHASFRDNGSLVDFLDKVLYTLLCEGDCVLLFDDGEIDDSGKVLMFAPDQIAPLPDSDFKARFKEGWTQCDGIIRDQFGRTMGVVVAPTPGLKVVPANEALILLKDDPYAPCNWCYVKRSFRDTIRGVADALPVLADLQDVNEILQYEKISAKRFAAQYAYITEAEAQSAVTPEGFLPEEPVEEGGEQNGEEKPEEYTVDHLQDITAGMLDLLPNGSSITFSPNDRPSPRTLEFVEAVREVAGGALGLTRSFALAKADTSYTAARWDTGVASKALAKISQFLDDHILDWLADRLIRWAVKKELIDESPDPDWVDAAAFTHPSGREVLDEVKEQQAIGLALKNGTANLEQLVGPGWRGILSELATEKKYAESLGLSLDMGETKSGQIVPTAQEETTETIEKETTEI